MGVGSGIAATDGSATLGHFMDDVAGSQHRLTLVGPLLALEALGQFPLAFGENYAILVFHSKSPFAAIGLFWTNAL